MQTNTTSVIGIECALRCDPQVRVNDKLVAINLYRIAQEAVNNAVKYSKAKHIWLDFSIVDEKYRFSVSDDGIGFDPKVLEPCEGMGLHSMRYRASLLGGSLDIRENPKGGTIVAVIYA